MHRGTLKTKHNRFLEYEIHMELGTLEFFSHIKMYLFFPTIRQARPTFTLFREFE